MGFRPDVRLILRDPVRLGFFPEAANGLLQAGKLEQPAPGAFHRPVYPCMALIQPNDGGPQGLAAGAGRKGWPPGTMTASANGPKCLKGFQTWRKKNTGFAERSDAFKKAAEERAAKEAAASFAALASNSAFCCAIAVSIYCFSYFVYQAASSLLVYLSNMFKILLAIKSQRKWPLILLSMKCLKWP